MERDFDQVPSEALMDVKMVLGDDGSPAADLAWDWINTHPWPGWNLEVVTATEPPLAPPAADGEPQLVEWESPFGRVANPDARLGKVLFLTTVADPRILLSRYTDAALLVVGSKGLNPLQALLLGSTTEWLLADPPSPLLVARSSHRVEKVLVAVDGSSHAHRAARAFTHLPWAGDTQAVMMVVDDGRIDRVSVEETLGVLREAAIEPEVHHAAGRPTNLILQQIDRQVPDLVVLGTRGLTGLDRLRLGSTAAAITRHGACSVLAAAE